LFIFVTDSIDGQGVALAGHLMSDNAVYTTAEITLAVHDDLEFTREPCNESGWDELVIREA
jgi:predicted DNA-binding protein with PD1-like motif